MSCVVQLLFFPDSSRFLWRYRGENGACITIFHVENRECEIAIGTRHQTILDFDSSQAADRVQQ